MALGFLLILSTAAMPRPHCLRERCVSELLLLTLMCVCVCVSTAGPIFLSRVVFDDYQWKWCRERRRKRETLKLSWNAAVTSIHRSFSRLFLPVTQKTNVRPYLPTQKTRGFLSVSQFSHVSLDFMTIFSSSESVSDTAQCSVCCTVAPRPPRCTRDRRRPWKEEFLKIKQRSVA